MPLLTIENLPGPPIAVPAGGTLLAAILAAGHDYRHACGARGRCTTCRVRVLAGGELLTEPTAAEMRYREAGRLAPIERLTCQARLPVGEVRGRVPEGAKLPHVQYLR